MTLVGFLQNLAFLCTVEGEDKKQLALNTGAKAVCPPEDIADIIVEAAQTDSDSDY